MSSRVPPLTFPSLAISLPPTVLPYCSSTLLLYLSPLLPLSSARFLPPLFLSLRPCIVPFLPHSFPFSTLPPFLYSRSHPTSHHYFLTPSPCSLPPPPSPCSLTNIHRPSSLLPPCRTQFNVHRVCGWQVVLSRPLLFSAKRRVALRQWGIHSCRRRLSMTRCYIQRTCSHHKSVFDE